MSRVGNVGKTCSFLLSVPLELLYSKPSKTVLESLFWSETTFTFLYFCELLPAVNLYICEKEDIRLPAVIYHILSCAFPAPLTSYICYSSSTIGDCNISVSYPWADIHFKLPPDFIKIACKYIWNKWKIFFWRQSVLKQAVFSVLKQAIQPQFYS